MSGLYVHIPYCRKKCIYCDFYSRGDRQADWSGLVTSLLREHHERSEGTGYDTIYIGGGTPSLIPLPELERLVEGITIAGMPEEFTIEVNPDDVTEEKATFWKSIGINRVSLGIQSFSDEELRFLNRRHTSAEAVAAYHLLRKYFDNISIDLIFALPGQSMEGWEKNVRRAIALCPEHISAYNLMFEEGTPITLLRDQGRIQEVDEEVSQEMYRRLHQLLRETGYRHYEISNFAKPGRESRHNSSYWRGIPYLGIGPAAHSYDGDRVRSFNLQDIQGYIRYYKDGAGEKPQECEHLTDEELREEYVMTRLRTTEGIALCEYQQRFGDTEYHLFLERAKELAKTGWIEMKGGRVVIPHEYWMISDSIICTLI